MKRTLFPTIALALVAASALAVRATRAPGAPSREVSGPYVHGNLAVFLIHGPEAAPGRNLLTLEEALAGKELKLAAKMKAEQGEVWKEVAEAQKALSEKVGERVNSPVSASSMELALENEKVRGSADEYVRALEAVVAARPDAIGYAFA